jgi:hypothetical protein
MKSSSVPHIRIARVDYGNPADCTALVMLLAAAGQASFMQKWL